jgi:hypothetical protein
MRCGVKIFWAPPGEDAGPGYPLQSFLPQTAKKDFRFYPWRMGGQAKTL